MKIILIQQAETDMIWAARYDAASFDQAVEEELRSPVAPVSVRKSDASQYRVYTGMTRASAETAELLFDLAEAPEKTPLLDDVPLRSCRDTKKLWPLWLWRLLGMLQWLIGSGRQKESCRGTLRRARQFVDLIEAEDRDCIVISRGLTMAALKAVLRRRGYCLEGGELRPKPLDRVRAVKQSLHCGGCHHNCLLSEAKCQIGQAKARERKAKDLRFSNRG